MSGYAAPPSASDAEPTAHSTLPQRLARVATSGRTALVALAAAVDLGVSFLADLKIGLYLTYLTGLLALMVLSRRWAAKSERDPLGTSSTVATQYVSLLGVSQFFLALGVLGRYWSPAAFLLLLGASQVGIVLPAVVSRRFGPRRRLLTHQAWSMYELTLTHPVLATLVITCAFQIWLALPIVTSVVYFTHAVPSYSFTILLFRIWLIYLSTSMAVMLLPLLSFLTSPVVDAKARAGWLVSMSCNAIPIGLYVSIAFWAFGAPGSHHELRGMTLTTSYFLVAALLGYLLITTVVPYLVGVFWRRRLQIELTRRRAALLGGLAEVLEISTTPLYSLRLKLLRREVAREGRRLSAQYLVVALAPAFEAHGSEVAGDEEAVNRAIRILSRRVGLPWDLTAEIGTPATETSGRMARLGHSIRILRAEVRQRWTIAAIGSAIPTMRRGYAAIRRGDPRFTTLAWLRQLALILRAIQEDLRSRRTIAEQSDSALAWRGLLEARRKELLEEIAALKRVRLPAWAPIGSAAATAATFLLSQFGHWIWTIAARALPK